MLLKKTGNGKNLDWCLDSGGVKGNYLNFHNLSLKDRLWNHIYILQTLKLRHVMTKKNKDSHSRLSSDNMIINKAVISVKEILKANFFVWKSSLTKLFRKWRLKGIHWEAIHFLRPATSLKLNFVTWFFKGYSIAEKIGFWKDYLQRWFVKFSNS